MPDRPLLVRLRNWVGDVTLGLPTLERLAAAGYSLQLLGKPWAPDLLAGQGWPVHVQPKGLRARVAQLRQLVGEARGRDPGFDGRLNAVAFPDSFSSALEMRLSGLRAIGHAHEGRSLLLARSVARPSAAHALETYWHLGSALLGQALPAPGKVHLAVAKAQVEQARELRLSMGIGDGYIVVCPFVGGTFEKLDKRWPEFAIFVAQDLPPLGRPLVICPGPSEEQEAARDYPACRQLPAVRLGCYSALLQGAALVVANDTGPGHMAAAVGSPLVSVLGPTDPQRWGAWGPTVQIVRGAAPASSTSGGATATRWPTRDAVRAAVQSALAGRPAQRAC